MSADKIDPMAVLDATVRARGAEWFRAHDKYFGRVAGIEKELGKLKAAENEAIAARAAVAALVEAATEYKRCVDRKLRGAQATYDAGIRLSAALAQFPEPQA